MSNIEFIVENKDEDDNWNSVVLSLATDGGYIIKHGKMSEITVRAPKFNDETMLLERIFLRYFIENKYLPELYEAVWKQRDELNLHTENNDDEERKFLEEEMDRAVLRYKKNNKKKSATMEDSPNGDEEDAESD